MRKRLVNLRVPAATSSPEGTDTETRDILIIDGRIAEVAPPSVRPAEADEERVDLQDRLVVPGTIDGHVHFDDPGFTHRENFASGTRAAAAGGVTCIVDMPCTSLPPVTSARHLEEKLAVIEPKAHVDFMLWGGVSANAMAEPDWVSNLEDVVAEGVGAIKVYMLSGMETFRDLGAPDIEVVLRQTHRLGVPVGVHAEDPEMVQSLTRRLMADGRDTPLDYAASRPPGRRGVCGGDAAGALPADRGPRSRRARGQWRGPRCCHRGSRRGSQPLRGDVSALSRVHRRRSA